MFRIIGIHTNQPPLGAFKVQNINGLIFNPDAEEYKNIMKILKPNTWYLFYKGYEIGQNGNIKRTEDVIPDDFYTSFEDISISFNAIVGMNGMGKSSLIELYIRIINNVTYVLYSSYSMYNSVYQYVRNIYATIYLEITTDRGFSYVQIRQAGDSLSIIYQGDHSNDFHYKLGDSVDEEIAKKVLSNFFYTEVINYSAFAFNPDDYALEGNLESHPRREEVSTCWIDSLYHKVDDYQSPIVINPARKNGQINYKEETTRAWDNLFELILLKDNPLKELIKNKEFTAIQTDTRDDLLRIPGAKGLGTSVLVKNQLQEINNKYGITLQYPINELPGLILKGWNQCLGFDIMELTGNRYNDRNDRDRTIEYIIYKTLNLFYEAEADYPFTYKDIQEYIQHLYNEHTFKTRKIRRCLLFLMFNKHDYNLNSRINLKDYREWMNNVESDRTTWNKLIAKYNKNISRFSKAHNWNSIEDIDLLPPPSFKYEPIISDKSGNVISTRTLSSGEKQLINMLSTVVYHLYNLEATKNNNDIVSYHNIEIIFDEVELYFHPEYQRQLVFTLVNSIRNMKLRSIKSINITVCTHSPFILSDIPSNCILALEAGFPTQKATVETFAANIYDILANRFFLNSFVGEFASNKIDYIVDLIERFPNEGDYNSIKKLIEYIGDDFIREKLLDQLRSKLPESAAREEDIANTQGVLTN